MSRPMTLRLRPLLQGRMTELELSGVLKTEMTSERRRRLLAILGVWSRGGLDVVLSVDADGLHAWCDGWTSALDAVPEHRLSVRFELSGPHSPGGRRDE